MEFLHLWGWWGLVGIPLFYLIYLFQQRQLNREIPSLLLWNLTENRGQSMTTRSFRWFDRLLILQFLFILLLTLAATSPQVITTRPLPRKIGLILDRTGSMKAPYSASKTRWQRAQEIATELLSSLEEEDRITVLFHPPQTTSTDSPPLSPQSAIRLINETKSTFEPGRVWKKYLRCQAVHTEVEKWWVVTDEHRGEKSWISVGRPIDNLAITQVATRSQSGQPRQVMVEVANFSRHNPTASVSISSKSGSFTRSRSLSLSEGEKKLLFFDLPATKGLYEISLDVDSDPFDLDNRAHLVSSIPPPVQVYFQGGKATELERAFLSAEKVEITSASHRAHIEVVLSGQSRSSAPFVVVGPGGKAPSVKWHPVQTDGEAFTVSSLGEVFPVFPSQTFALKSWRPFSTTSPKYRRWLRARGTSPLPSTWAGAWGNIHGREYWILSFLPSTSSTNWTKQATFPLFWHLFVERVSATLPTQFRHLAIGESFLLPPNLSSLTSPSGKTLSLGHRQSFVPRELGLYTTPDGDHYPVNFTHSQESNLLSRESWQGAHHYLPPLPYGRRPYLLQIPLLIVAGMVLLLIWHIEKKRRQRSDNI